ncbi:MAG: SGNH hydrolase domain-containing protein, partial [Chlorobiaceae bacterium]
IGLISFSLYLWHWPLFAFAKYLIFRELTPFEITGIIFATFLISIFSLKFIEQPFRGTEPVLPDRKNLFALSAMTMIIASIIGTAIYLQKGLPGRYPDVSIVLKDISDDPEWDKAGEYEKITARLSEGKVPARVGVKNSTPSFILWGDSHARALIPAVSLQANQLGISGFITTQSSHPPILGMDGIESNMNVFCNHTFNDGVISFIKQHPDMKTVILAAVWECYANGIHFKQIGGTTLQFKDVTGITRNQSNLSFLKIGLTRTIVALTSLGCHVVIVSDVPDIGYDAGRIYWLSNIVGGSAFILPTLAEYRERNKNVYALLSELALCRNVTIIYPESLLVDKTGRTIIMAKNKLYYRDSQHLSKYGAEFVSPVFDEVFKTIVNKSILQQSFSYMK